MEERKTCSKHFHLRYGWRRGKHIPDIFIWNLWNYITDYVLENPILSLHISDTYVSVRKPMNGH
jgi:hypothetical protein